MEYSPIIETQQPFRAGIIPDPKHELEHVILVRGLELRWITLGLQFSDKNGDFVRLNEIHQNLIVGRQRFIENVIEETLRDFAKNPLKAGEIGPDKRR
jgi:hypothetical protein